MNQILLTENNGGRGNGPVNTKKIILVFAIIIIIFGLLIMAVGIYQMTKNKSDVNNQQINNDPVITETPTPETPASSVPDEDTEEPTVQLSILGNKIKVVAKDDVALAYVEYTWNNGEQHVVEPEENATDKTVIETYIDILAGKNTLRVNAVDATGKSKDKTQEFKGRVLPVITPYITSEGNAVILKVTCDDGIDHVVWKLNEGMPIQIVFSGSNANATKEQWAEAGVNVEITNGKVISFEYTYPLSEEATKLTVTAYSLVGEVETYEGNIN